MKTELNKEDIRNLRDANRKCGYALPRFNRKGCMVDAQWQSWKKLQAAGLAIMESAGHGAEVEDLVLTAKGRNALRKAQPTSS